MVVKHGPPALIPTTCGVCDSKLVTEGEFISCRNNQCRAIVEGRIKNWVEAQDVHDFGGHIIGELVKARLVKEPSDLYKLKFEDIAALEHMGEVSAKKLLANLKGKLPLNLPLFLASLGIEHFGLLTAKLIVGHGLDTLDKLPPGHLGAARRDQRSGSEQGQGRGRGPEGPLRRDRPPAGRRRGAGGHRATASPYRC